MKKLFTITAVVCAFLTGCTDVSVNSQPDTTSDTQTVSRTSGVSYVCIGMETSARFGDCPGCKKDSNRMNALFRDSYGYTGVLLQSENATRATVAKAIATAVASTPADGLFILYYSGHGGQENLSGWNTSEPDGADSEDEYLCLYDSYLLDDEIWKLISSCKGRVFCCFDACHSQTMFRSISSDISVANAREAIPLEVKMVKSSGFNLKPRAMALDADNDFRMLCWGGCKEAEYSFGSNTGGVMTNYILKYWNADKSYSALWSLVMSGVTKDQPTQHPVATQYGEGFGKVFR